MKRQPFSFTSPQGVAISIYNLYHPKFHLKFISPEDQLVFAELFRKRMSLRNPLDDEEMDFNGVDVKDFPDEDDGDWEAISLEELEEFRELWKLPILTVGQISGVFL